jgi:hypothetical protein
LLTESLWHLGQHQFDRAFAASDLAFHDAARRGYRLIQSDALNLRARARLAQSKSEAEVKAARRDASNALNIAEKRPYPWGERDAFEVLVIVHEALGNQAEAIKSKEEATRLSQKLSG